jgi:hypothetical protein
MELTWATCSKLCAGTEGGFAVIRWSRCGMNEAARRPGQVDKQDGRKLVANFAFSGAYCFL